MSGRDIVAVDAPKLRRDEARVRKGFWRKLRRVCRRIPFAEDLLAAYFCAIDRETPRYVKALLMGAIAYFVVPTDLLPDFIAGFGFTDDATVLLTALNTVDNHVKPRHREAAHQRLQALAGEADATEA
jgi:uncharacterized membrane protein YkvA (DUF1232 family)